MAEKKPTVFIVDDDKSIRDSISLLLKSADYEVLTFSSAIEFLESDPSLLGGGCIVLDVKMRELSGLDLQEELSARNINIPIVFITGHGDIPMSVQAIKKGAVDFLQKPFDDVKLIESINEALEKNILTKTTEDEIQKISQKFNSLSPREFEVMRYLIGGLLNKQIGYELNISERTVKAHRKQVMEKMGISSIADLVRLSEKAGIKPLRTA